MLDQIEIANYRSCIRTSFKLQPDLSVLIGPNSAGKTNVLKAILLLRQLATEPPFLRESEEPGSRSRLKATFLSGKKKAKLTARLTLLSDEKNNDVITGSNQSWYAKDYTGSAKRLDVPLAMAGAFSRKKDRPEFTRYVSGARIAYSLGRSRGRYMLHSGELENLPKSFESELGSISDFLIDMKYYGASRFTNPALVLSRSK